MATKKVTKASKPSGFTADERAAMKERVRELVNRTAG